MTARPREGMADMERMFCETCPVSSPPQAMRPVFAAVQPVLKDLGYRRSGSTFQRTIEPDGLVHVVEFQRGGFINTVPGERRVTTQYGGFTVNLGVWLPGVSQQMLVPM